MTRTIKARQEFALDSESLAECCELSRRAQRGRRRGVGAGGAAAVVTYKHVKHTRRGSRRSRDGDVWSEQHAELRVGCSSAGNTIGVCKAA